MLNPTPPPTPPTPFFGIGTKHSKRQKTGSGEIAVGADLGVGGGVGFNIGLKFYKLRGWDWWYKPKEEEGTLL